MKLAYDLHRFRGVRLAMELLRHDGVVLTIPRHNAANIPPNIFLAVSIFTYLYF